MIEIGRSEFGGQSSEVGRWGICDGAQLPEGPICEGQTFGSIVSNQPQVGAVVAHNRDRIYADATDRLPGLAGGSALRSEVVEKVIEPPESLVGGLGYPLMMGGVQVGHGRVLLVPGSPRPSQQIPRVASEAT